MFLTANIAGALTSYHSFLVYGSMLQFKKGPGRSKWGKPAHHTEVGLYKYISLQRNPFEAQMLNIQMSHKCSTELLMQVLYIQLRKERTSSSSCPFFLW